ncbi:MAG: zinc-dependent peptidase [Crocinitomicaceae bacterium]|nr:zinc-dependent peptidase [Crocinitomicaceae bacterium]
MGWISKFLGLQEDKPRHSDFSEEWRAILNKKIGYYRSLESSEQIRFEAAILRFLNTTKITGIKTNVTDEDYVLIGASAVIPIFAFPDWEYHNLDEVLLYPEHFDRNHTIGSKQMAILGMVGYGYMEGKMTLSKKSLHHGFTNDTDKQNTAIHEFIHLIDKMDGKVDGIMVYLKEKSYVLPWINLIDEKIKEIEESDIDIRKYGATSRQEFLAVISEYFFERPKLLRKNHPVLYEYLELMFNQPLADRKLVKKAKPTQHFEPCPCGSGKKFRECCMS